MNTAGPFAYLAGSQENPTETSLPPKDHLHKQLADTYTPTKSHVYGGADGHIRSDHVSQSQVEAQILYGHLEDDFTQEVTEADLLWRSGYDTVELMERDGGDRLENPFAFSASELEKNAAVRHGIADILDGQLAQAESDGIYTPIIHANYKHGASSWIASYLLSKSLRDPSSVITTKVNGSKAHGNYSKIKVTSERGDVPSRVSNVWLHYAELFMAMGNRDSKSQPIDLFESDLVSNIIALAGYLDINPSEIFAAPNYKKQPPKNATQNMAMQFQQLVKLGGYKKSEVLRAYEEVHALFQNPFYNRNLATVENFPTVIPRINIKPSIDFLTCNLDLESLAYEYVVRNVRNINSSLSTQYVIVCFQPTAAIDSVASNYLYSVAKHKKKKIRGHHRAEADVFDACKAKFDSTALKTVYMAHSLLVLPKSLYGNDKARFLMYGFPPVEDNMGRLARRSKIDDPVGLVRSHLM